MGGADTIGLHMARSLGDGGQIVVGLVSLRAAESAKQLDDLGLSHATGIRAVIGIGHVEGE
ncbi:hypothetical protein DIJ64_03280 [Mycobacterium leprae]|uniref:Uncharacterized protein n=1 Tax=Mycobacterium leprae TaxID=1769 RepID=A0AAD0P801_MYCLR|nr:hypothetical protein DIJ64_03280 [Mycobacterium leprae]